MSDPTEEIEPDLSHIHWSFPEAIAANPARSLATPDLAMDYFAYSPFWDPKSNNNVLRVQRRIEQPTYGHAEEKMELGAFNSGFEYIVAHSQPPRMFVIHRREVQPGGRGDKVDAIYWILNDRIYPTPTLYDIMANRTKNAAFLLSETFSTLSALRPPSNPRTNNVWRSLPPSEKPKPPAQSTQMEVDNTEDTPKDGEEEKKEEGEGDWNLFHALESTKMAMGDLQRMSRSTPLSDLEKGREELKRIEKELGARSASTNTNPATSMSMSTGPRHAQVANGLGGGGTPIYLGSTSSGTPMGNGDKYSRRDGIRCASTNERRVGQAISMKLSGSKEANYPYIRL